MKVYPGARDLPLSLSQLASELLSQLGGDNTFKLMIRLASAGLLARGSLSRGSVLTPDTWPELHFIFQVLRQLNLEKETGEWEIIV